MPVPPIVRYMILCDDWHQTPDKDHRIVIDGLLTNLHSESDPPFPFVLKELCVVLILTEGRGPGSGKIVAVFEETGEQVFETRSRDIALSSDPLDITGVPFRIQGCPFRKPGMYSIQFWYDGAMIEERPLRLL